MEVKVNLILRDSLPEGCISVVTDDGLELGQLDFCSYSPNVLHYLLNK